LRRGGRGARARFRAALGGRRLGRVAGRDRFQKSDHFADRRRFAFFLQDLGDDSGLGRRQFDRGFIAFNFDEVLA